MATIPPGIDASARPDVASFFDAATNTISHVVSDPATRACAAPTPRYTT